MKSAPKNENAVKTTRPKIRRSKSVGTTVNMPKKKETNSTKKQKSAKAKYKIQ